MYRLCRVSPAVRLAIQAKQPSRNFLWRPYWWRHRCPTEFEDRFRHLDREMERWFREPNAFFNRSSMRDFWRDDSPTAIEFFRMHNPIVEKDGKQFMKLEFDVRRFKPEEVKVKTKGTKLEIEAHHESKGDDFANKYEFSRAFNLPDGVKADEVTCRYTEDGTLLVEAPYTPPPEAAKPQETEIPVKHE